MHKHSKVFFQLIIGLLTNEPTFTELPFPKVSFENKTHASQYAIFLSILIRRNA